VFGRGGGDDASVVRTLIAVFAHFTELTAPRSDLVARFHLLIIARAPTRPLGAAPSRCSLRGARTADFEPILEHFISSAAIPEPHTDPATPRASTSTSDARERDSERGTIAPVMIGGAKRRQSRADAHERMRGNQRRRCAWIWNENGDD